MASCSAAVAVCANARDPSSAPATPAARPNNRRRVIRDQCIVPGPRSVPNILRSPEDTPLPHLARHVQPVVRGSAAAATAIRGWGGIAPCIQVPQEKSGRIAAGLDRFRWGGGTSWSPSYYKYLVDGVASGRVARYLGHDSWRGGAERDGAELRRQTKPHRQTLIVGTVEAPFVSPSLVGHPAVETACRRLPGNDRPRDR